MDIFSTRAQLAAIDLMERDYTFLFDSFCTDLGAVENDKAIYDYRRGVQSLAPVVHDGVGGVITERGGYETREVGFCTVAPERVIENIDLQSRAFGEKILGAMTPAQREKKMLVKDLSEMRLAIQRRREHMARQVLLTGKLELFRYTNEGRDKETTKLADYGFQNHYTPETKWSDPGAKIDHDMHNIYDMVYEGLGIVEKIVMAPDVADAMLENSNYLKKLDGRNIDMGKINTRYRGQGVRFLGWNSDGVEMYSYSGKFRDDDGRMYPQLPSGTLIAGGSGVIRCAHGPVTQVEHTGPNAQHVTYIKKEVPLRYGSIESNAIKNRLTSRPTITPFNVGAWAVAHLL